MARPKAPGVADIERDFTPVRADEEQAALHDQVNDILRKAALALNKVLPAGRHASMARTFLEQALWSANSAVAHDRDLPQVTVMSPNDYKGATAAPAKKAAAKKTVVKAAARVKVRDAEILDRLADEEPKAAPAKRVARRASRP